MGALLFGVLPLLARGGGKKRNLLRLRRGVTTAAATACAREDGMEREGARDGASETEHLPRNKGSTVPAEQLNLLPKVQRTGRREGTVGHCDKMSGCGSTAQRHDGDPNAERTCTQQNVSHWMDSENTHTSAVRTVSNTTRLPALRRSVMVRLVKFRMPHATMDNVQNSAMRGL
jgi:hypothetical protein